MMSERSRARSLVDLISQSKGPAVESFPLATLDQVQEQLLDHDTMLLEYALGEERSYLWTVTADSFQSYELPGREAVETAARELYELTTSRQSELGEDYPARIAHSENLYFEKAQKLSQILLGPVADRLGSRRLLVVADGALQYLPFEALPLQTSQSLIETNEIVRLPSISTLMAIRSRTRTEQSSSKVAALIVDPVFSRNDDRVSGEFLTASAAPAARSSSIKISPVPARLSYAATEVEAITQAAPTGTTLLASGFDASRNHVVSMPIGDYQIVHFGTHAFLNSQQPESSGMLLSMVDQNGVEQDGVMSLNDIYKLDLNANLTVLSACQTALGKDVRGEGLVGLTHGFISAGSRSVIASLWKVDDRATAYLMAEFYKSMLEQNMTPSAALRTAKLKMMRDKQWSAPYFWAGFVLQGEYNNRIVIDRNSHSTLVLLFIVPAISFVLFKAVRNRLKQ